MLNVVDVTQAFGARVLFEHVTVSFSPGKRYGLTGPNGAGKSTLMKFLAGDAEPTSGNVSRPARTSILRQNQFGFDEYRAIDVVIMGNKALWEALQERNALLEKAEAGADFTDEMGIRLGELEGVVAEEDGYTAESDAARLLDGLGLEEELHTQPLKKLSGGYKLRVLLAQALFGKPHCLLLDEPTNHLDGDSIHWLEKFLLGYEGILVVISHDRHFLNAVTTHIADIDYESIITYTGNYDDMVLQKSQVRSRVESENADRKKKVAQLQDFVSRFGAGTRASQVQSRKKEIEKLAVTDLKKSNIQRPFIRFQVGERGGKDVLRAERLAKTFTKEDNTDIRICKDLDLYLPRGEKLAIIGPSGIGKTTLLRMLMGEVKQDAGTIQWGHGVDTGYFPQEIDKVVSGKRLWEWLYAIDDSGGTQAVRGLLARMLFSGEEAEKVTDVLSGGETVRLLFARLMLLQHNVLIFDEPTNHLDLESVSALRDCFKAYEGTLIVVTHDHDLISDSATRILAMGRRGIEDFQGSYEEYLRKHGDQRLDR